MTNSRLDLRIGEARVVRDVTFSIFNPKQTILDLDQNEWDYRAAGYKPLVAFLEEKHGAKVVITNGANQALHAAMHALKINGLRNVGMRIPYWNRIPDIIRGAGLKCTTFNQLVEGSGIDSYLLTLPNNPDGYIPSLNALRETIALLQELKIPLVHDAVYYSPSYLPVDYPVESWGDMQIFSASKHYGLSGLRVGYIVVHNPKFYQALVDFVEFTTVGVSVTAQQFFLKLLQREEELPKLKTLFHSMVRRKLEEGRALFKKLRPGLLTLPPNFDATSGVFAWVVACSPQLFDLAEIDVLPGGWFGMPGWSRINLGAGNNIIAEMVDRLNQVPSERLS